MNETVNETVRETVNETVSIAARDASSLIMDSDIGSIATGKSQPMFQMPTPSLKDKYNMDKLTNLLQSTFASTPTIRNANNGSSGSDGGSGGNGGSGSDGNLQGAGKNTRASREARTRRILTQLLESLEAQSSFAHGTSDHHDHDHDHETSDHHDHDHDHDHGHDHPYPTTHPHPCGHITNPSVVIKIHRSSTSSAKLPTYGSPEAAGADLSALEGGSIQPGQRKLIGTGIRMDIPKGYEVQIRPRSGLALKKGVTMLNTPGTIDSDYKGEIGLIAINHSQEVFHYEQGDRLAQAVVAPVVQGLFVDAPKGESISESERGSSGFGSTGV